MASLPQQPGVSHSCLPQVVKQALAAGKHVIEEKPIALTFEDAVPLIRHYRSMQQAAASDGGGPSPLWMLAENYRYEQVFSEACAMACALTGFSSLRALTRITSSGVSSRTRLNDSGSTKRTDNTTACTAMDAPRASCSVLNFRNFTGSDYRQTGRWFQ